MSEPEPYLHVAIVCMVLQFGRGSEQCRRALAFWCPWLKTAGISTLRSYSFSLVPYTTTHKPLNVPQTPE